MTPRPSPSDRDREARAPREAAGGGAPVPPGARGGAGAGARPDWRASSERLRRRYVLALGAIALVALVAHGLVHAAFSGLDDVPRTLVAATRQLARAERLLAAVDRLVAGEDGTDGPARAAAGRDTGVSADEAAGVRDVLVAWSRTHGALRAGSGGFLAPGPDLALLLEQAGRAREAMDGAARRVLAAAARDPSAAGSARARLRQEAQAFRLAMEAVVDRLRARFGTSIAMLEQSELAALTLTLFALLMAGILVFRPAIEGVGDVMSELARSERRAQGIAEELGAKNRALRRAAREAEAAARAKSQFLASMSHELRTPLNGVLGLAELLVTSDLEDEQRDWVETIQGSGADLLAMIDDILEYARTDREELEVAVAPLDVRALVDRVATARGSEVRERDLELVLHVDEDVPLVLEGDVERVERTLDELLGNAIRFAGHGEVGVHVAKEHETEGRPTLRFEVWDTGPGITPALRRELFSPFFQADRSSTRRIGGAGLGLALCRKRMDALGGTIGVDSEPGEGSVFWFTVPLDRPAGGTATPEAPRCLVGLCAFVASPRSSLRRALVDPLRRWGVRVTPLSSWDELAAALDDAVTRGTTPDVVLLDASLGGPDGGASRPSDPALSRVVWTRLDGRATSGPGTLAKPVRRPALLQHLVDVARGPDPDADHGPEPQGGGGVAPRRDTEARGGVDAPDGGPPERTCRAPDGAAQRRETSRTADPAKR